MSYPLPLSWACTTAARPRLHLEKLPLSGKIWAPTAEIPFDYPFEQLFERRLRRLPGGFVLQFCRPTLSRYLVEAGGQAIYIGQEGVLDLTTDALDKPSLQALVRRGKRWGTVQEVNAAAQAGPQLARLKSATRHASKPQLALAFRTRLDEAGRCFAFVTPTGDWLAAITLSQSSRHTFHTELLLRHQDAPTGVMEALVAHIFNRLQTEGANRWSLGGVPFAPPPSAAAVPALTPAWLKTQATLKLGQQLKFAYNYYGLFNFKNKFNPGWQPLYLCGYPSLPWRALLDLAYKMRYMHLVSHQLYACLTAALRR